MMKTQAQVLELEKGDVLTWQGRRIEIQRSGIWWVGTWQPDWWQLRARRRRYGTFHVMYLGQPSSA